jgi:hypothetical protein
LKLIIAGCRHLEVSKEFINAIIKDKQWIVTRVISGGARGIDLCGEAWAEDRGIPYVRFVPGWKMHGRRYAAYVRNHDMGFYGDQLLAIWDGKSPGTKHMIQTMKELNKPYEVVLFN